MTALIAPLDEADVRRICWEKLEALEHWLRRLIDDSLSAKHGDYFASTDGKGNRIIKSAIAQDAIARREREPQRYPRAIDALLLEDAIDIICNPQLFKDNFRVPLELAFPEGRDEARTFLKRISSPRNSLAHANAIGLRQAEQIICYTNDVIDSLKAHYRQIGMQETYDAPLILKVTDSFGNSYSRSQFSLCHDGGIMKAFLESREMHLRPGDVLALEIEVDPSYDPASYKIRWSSTKPWSDQPQVSSRVVVPITNRQVGQQFDIQCRVTANREWHRMSMGADDFFFDALLQSFAAHRLGLIIHSSQSRFVPRLNSGVRGHGGSMGGLWQTIIGGLAVAAITGLSVIAYRHPAAYGRIYRPLVRMMIGAWAVWFIYSIGFTTGFSNALLATMKLNSGTIIKTPSRDSTSFWLYMVPVIVYAYLSFLQLLPHFLREEAPSPENVKDEA